MQHTLTSALTFSGKGLHTGLVARLTIKPAPINTGLVFVRDDLFHAHIPVLFSAVSLEKAVLCTWLEGQDKTHFVQTIEHVLSALYAFGIDNAFIHVSSAEVPILDGSALPFITAMRAVGRTAQIAPRRMLRIIKAVEIAEDDKVARLEPSATHTMSLDYTVEYAGLGRQHLSMVLDDSGAYAEHIAPARTFTLKSVVDGLQARGLGLGGTLDNAVVIDDATGQPLNPTGLRFKDEAVRHKILDAVGDLALAGAPIIGHFVCVKGGHALTNKLLRQVFQTPDAFEWVTAYAGITLPDTGSASTRLQPLQTAV